MKPLNKSRAYMSICKKYGYRCLHYPEALGNWCSACGETEYEPPKPEAEQQAKEIARDTEWLGEVTK